MVDQNRPPQPEEITLEVDGQVYRGWEKLELVRSLEAISAAFSLAVSSRLPWPILPEQEMVLRLGDDVLATGFMDEFAQRGGDELTSVEVRGRDSTADLADASATNEPGEWRDLIIHDLLPQIAEPFGVRVDVRPQRFNQEPFARFALQTGETAYSAIERACRLRALLPYSTGDGVLRVERPAARSVPTEVALVEGENVSSYELHISRRERFATYIVRGQIGGSDEFFGDNVILVEGRATDPLITRFRPLLVVAEGAVTMQEAEARAQWEATFRAARAAQLTVEVQGLRQERLIGRPWSINERVPVRIPSVQLDSEMLISGVRMTQDPEAGQITVLTLTRPDAYTPKPEVTREDDPFDDLLEMSEVGGG